MKLYENGISGHVPISWNFFQVSLSESLGVVEIKVIKKLISKIFSCIINSILNSLLFQ